MNPIIFQILCYSCVMLLTIFLFFGLLRGFLWEYLRVRASFGRLLLIKIRTPLRDYYRVGRVDEGMLKFKHGKDKKIIKFDSSLVYRCMQVNWVDFDEEKNALAKTDYTAVSGFDAIKFNDLLVRALMRPTIKSQFERYALLILLGVLFLCLASAYLSYISYKNTEIIKLAVENLPGYISSLKGTVVGGTTI